jgi:hypothetical protein
MQVLNEKRFAQVVESGLEQAHGNKRWTNAIKRGAELIEANRFLEMENSRTLLILGASSQSYEVNRVWRSEVD